jgi:sirohydrochlorin ferrochelatase
VKTGLIVFAHGSSVASANQAVEKVAADMARLGGFEIYETAFLEAARPDLSEAVARLIPKGVEKIVVLPYFLTLGIHLTRDLPRIVTELSLIHNGVEIVVTDPLDGHPALKEILLDRARKALGA